MSRNAKRIGRWLAPCTVTAWFGIAVSGAAHVSPRSAATAPAPTNMTNPLVFGAVRLCEFFRVFEHVFVVACLACMERRREPILYDEWKDRVFPLWLPSGVPADHAAPSHLLVYRDTPRFPESWPDNLSATAGTLTGDARGPKSVRSAQSGTPRPDFAHRLCAIAPRGFERLRRRDPRCITQMRGHPAS